MTPAEVYERHLVPAIFGPWAAELVAVAAPRAGERVLDLACGTGIVARLAAEHAGGPVALAGVDANPRMLDVARARPCPSGVTTDWREASAVALPFSDASFDLVLCQQGLQFFPDRPQALRECRRVLGLGGRVAVAVWSDIRRSPGFAALADGLTRHVSADAGKWAHGPFALADGDALRELLVSAGFQEVTLRVVGRMVGFPSAAEFVRWYVAATPLADHVARAAPGAEAALAAYVAAQLAGYAKDELAFPMEAHIAMGRIAEPTEQFRRLP